MHPPENTEVFVTSITRSWWGEPGILFTFSTPGDRNMESYRELMELYAKLSENGAKKFCLLADISETRPVTKELREFIAEETSKSIKAMAFVSSTSVGSATGSIYEMLSHTPYMVATFTNREEALRWLRLQLSNTSSLDTVD